MCNNVTEKFNNSYLLLFLPSSLFHSISFIFLFRYSLLIGGACTRFHSNNYFLLVLCCSLHSQSNRRLKSYFNFWINFIPFFILFRPILSAFYPIFCSISKKNHFVDFFSNLWSSFHRFLPTFVIWKCRWCRFLSRIIGWKLAESHCDFWTKKFLLTLLNVFLVQLPFSWPQFPLHLFLSGPIHLTSFYPFSSLFTFVRVTLNENKFAFALNNPPPLSLFFHFPTSVLRIVSLGSGRVRQLKDEGTKRTNSSWILFIYHLKDLPPLIESSHCYIPFSLFNRHFSRS